MSGAWAAYLKKNTAAGDDVTPENFEGWATSTQREIMSLVVKGRERKLNPSAKAEEEEEVILDEKTPQDFALLKRCQENQARMLMGQETTWTAY